MNKIIYTLMLFILFTQLVPPADVFAAPPRQELPNEYTFETQPDAQTGTDTFISTPFDNNWGGWGVIAVGERNSNSDLMRGLIKFDLGQIPTNATVLEATLTLWVSGENADNSASIRVHNLTSAWVEGGARWDYANTNVPWNSPGGDYGAQIGTASVASDVAVDTEVSWTLEPGAVQGMIENGDLGNFGFLLKSNAESNDLIEFYSSDTPLEAYRPRLVIKYQALPPEDPGWYCVQNDLLGVAYWHDCPTPNVPHSPYNVSGIDSTPLRVLGGNIGVTGATLNCTPRPECINNFPIYYAVSGALSWHTDEDHYVHIMGAIIVQSGGRDIYRQDIDCGTGESGACEITVYGVVQPADLPTGETGLDMSAYFESYEEGTSGWPWFSSWDRYSVEFSMQPIIEDCAERYLILSSIGPITIDPTLELPTGEPTDEQKLETLAGQIYAIDVEGGPWSDGVEGSDPRYDTAVSWDGVEWVPLIDLVDDAICVHHNDWAHLDLLTIYIIAPTDTFYIRANDGAGLFSNNISLDPLFYSLGIAVEIAEPPCESQFNYDPDEDWVASVRLPADDDAVKAYWEMVGNEWYAIEVVSGTWNEPGGTDRIDMEYLMNGNVVPHDDDVWSDLAEDGGNEVYCVSEDSKTVFVQASELALWLRVNDQDENFSNNEGELNINIYHTAFVRDTDACEQTFTLHDRVAGGSVDAQAENGKLAAVSTGDIITFGLEPGGWYAIETKGASWGYLASTDERSYKAAIRTTATSAWQNMLDWAEAECVVEVDAVGHVRAYFQVPETPNEYTIRVDDTSDWNGNMGSLGWDIYQVVKLDDDDSEDGCDYIYDPDQEIGGGWVNAKYKNGETVYGLRLDTFYYLRFDADQFSWQEESGGPPLYDMQISDDNGETWYSLPDQWGGTLCYVRTGNVLGIFFKTGSGSEVGYKYKLRVDSTSFDNNDGGMQYTLFIASPGDDINPWENCMTGHEMYLINSLEWIPVKDEKGTYINGTTLTGDGDSQVLQITETYAMEITEGPWHPQALNMGGDSFKAQISSDNGDTWYDLDDKNNPSIYCAYTEQTKRWWTVVFTVQEGQLWKVRVADQAGEFRDNSGNLAYKLYSVSGDDVPPVDVGDGLNDLVQDVCEDPLIRPVPPTVGLDIIFEGYAYLAEWSDYARLAIQKYFAWCPRHTDLLKEALDLLKEVEPLATWMEIETITQDVGHEVDSYNWDAGPQNTSIFDLNSSSQVNSMINNNILRDDAEAFAPWEGGRLVLFNDHTLPRYYYSCNTNFSDYLPSGLRRGVCFASAYAQETGMSFWIQITLDISALFLIWNILKDSVAELVYMMTGVRPWTRAGAVTLVERIGAGGSVIQDEWWDAKSKSWRTK